MTPGYLARGLVALLATHALISSAVAFLIAWTWPRLSRTTGGSASAAARRLFAVRMAPTLVSLAVTGGVAGAYLLWEPRAGTERMGPLVLALAGLGAGLIGSSAVRAGRALLESRRLVRVLRRSARGILPARHRHADIVEADFPVVAVAGILKPRLIIARSVTEACTDDEVRAMVAHEHGHRTAHDNLRRLLLRAAPDILWWVRAGARLERDWTMAAELAADDVAGASRRERLHLASALVKVARLATAPARALPASALYRGEPITERVKRLVELPASPVPSASPWRARLAALTLLATAPLWMRAAYAAVEALVRVG